MQGKKKKKLFWLPAVAPLLSVILSTLIVYLTRGDKHGINIVKHIKDGLNPSSVNLLQFNSPYVGDVAKVGLIVALVALAVSHIYTTEEQMNEWFTNFYQLAPLNWFIYCLYFVKIQEAIAVGRSFSTMKGYHIDGNKEMMAMGFMNVVGSCTSCYVATGKHW